MTDTTLDRLARVAIDATTLRGHAPEDVARAVVRAILLELREPTQAMENAGHDSGDMDEGIDAAECWRAMIDCVLEGK